MALSPHLWNLIICPKVALVAESPNLGCCFPFFPPTHILWYFSLQEPVIQLEIIQSDIKFFPHAATGKKAATLFALTKIS